jgi:hypothetical protein
MKHWPRVSCSDAQPVVAPLHPTCVSRLRRLPHAGELLLQGLPPFCKPLLIFLFRSSRDALCVAAEAERTAVLQTAIDAAFVAAGPDEQDARGGLIR